MTPDESTAYAGALDLAADELVRAAHDQLDIFIGAEDDAIYPARVKLLALCQVAAELKERYTRTLREAESR